MNKNIFDLAMHQMSGFSLDKSSYSDNRSIFSIIDKLLRSAAGERLDDCRKPLQAVMQLKFQTPNDKFMGCKLKLLQNSIRTLFVDKRDLLPERIFAGLNRNMLLEYLEACKRIHMTQYVVPGKADARRDSAAKAEPEHETEMGRLIRLATENSKKINPK